MRLKPQEIQEIVKIGKSLFGENCQIYIFGSRIDNTKKGGDIDIYIETNLDIPLILENKIKFLVSLVKAIGEQKIDVIVFNPKKMKKEHIHEIAKKEGIRIW